jgi:hypothetical protein
MITKDLINTINRNISKRNKLAEQSKLLFVELEDFIIENLEHVNQPTTLEVGA